MKSSKFCAVLSLDELLNLNEKVFSRKAWHKPTQESLFIS
ncbi:Uncharacterised protein [Oligella ureolytica]|uniref:Uncharacterized protein n=1 Tax=Oligella ureolytica TaxID=90244 RepID=A0A378XB89_9BURK|nr:Uncharacterised protein [Oligella ureolytica]